MSEDLRNEIWGDLRPDLRSAIEFWGSAFYRTIINQAQALSFVPGRDRPLTILCRGEEYDFLLPRIAPQQWLFRIAGRLVAGKAEFTSIDKCRWQRCRGATVEWVARFWQQTMKDQIAVDVCGTLFVWSAIWTPHPQAVSFSLKSITPDDPTYSRPLLAPPPVPPHCWDTTRRVS